MKQVFQVFFRQAGTQDSFEKVARDMRLLTKRELADLSLAQIEQTPSIAEILVDMGFVSEEILKAQFHGAHAGVANPNLSRRKQTKGIAVQD